MFWANKYKNGSNLLILRQTHRVGRVLSFFSSRRNWDSPNPSPACECASPPRFWGRGTLACERGVGRVPIPTRGHRLWYSLYIRTLWADGLYRILSSYWLAHFTLMKSAALFWFGLRDVGILQLFYSWAIIQRTIVDSSTFSETGLGEKLRFVPIKPEFFFF